MSKVYASAKILFDEAEKLHLKPQWETPYWLFSIETSKGKQFVFCTKLFANSQLGAWISQDKYAAKIVLGSHDLPVIPYCYATKLSEINRFFDLHKKIIKKPLYGERAQGVELITQRNQLKNVLPRDFLFEQYIAGEEYRIWILQGDVVALQEKKLTPTDEAPWKKYVTNLPEQHWIAELIEMSKICAEVLHMKFLAVDFLQDKNGKYWLLETNSMPGLYPLHYPNAGEPINMAKKLLENIIIPG